MFVDTGVNCNTISRTLFEQLIDRGLVSEFIKGPETGVRINLVGGQNLVISGDKAKKKIAFWRMLEPTWDNQEGVRVESLHLKVDPHAQFRIQPCRLIWRDILGSRHCSL